MDGVHIMDESLHCLVHTSYRLIDSMLTHAVYSRQLVERLLDIVHERFVVKGTVILAIEILERLQFLNI